MFFLEKSMLAPIMIQQTSSVIGDDAAAQKPFVGVWEVWARMWECGERSGNARLREDEDAPLLLAELG